MRYLLVLLAMLLCPAVPAQAQISVHIELPGIDIGINMPVYPRLVRVPGYPVYYDPQVNSNYFFYDGLYWVFQSDNWYASSWYNGPWELVEPYDVPLYLLRVPVRYYRHPPAYFHGWRADAPPRWGEHWGSDWERRRSGWDQWDRRSVPAPAPLPTYQRQYSGDRYPRAPEQQVTIRNRNYRYQPREAVTQQHFQRQVQPHAAPGGTRAEPPRQAPTQQRPQPSRPQAPQARPEQQQIQPRQPVQQAQPRQEQPRRSMPPGQPKPPPAQVHQPNQPPAQAQHAPAAPETRATQNRAAPQGKGPENKPAPQGKAPENRSAPHGKGQENKDAPHGKGQENKTE